MREGEFRDPSGCAISGVIDRSGRRMSGACMIDSIATMHDRSNGLGGGFAGYGIYPEFKDYYAFHLFYDDVISKKKTEDFIQRHFDIAFQSAIPTRETKGIGDAPILFRYFVLPDARKLESRELDEEEYVVRCVNRINTEIRGAFVFSCGKNMGIFKAVGYPEDVGRFYRPASFYEENAVEVRLNTRAAAVDAEKKRVLLADGSFVPYDKLLVATGSRPFIPPTAGYESVERKFTFMTMDDALALERELLPDRRVLVVGAGLIGLKCVEGILDRVRSVTVVDMADRILSSILDEEGAALVRRQLEEKGVRFVLGDRVAEYAGNTARLAGGAEIAFDVLVTAVGVRPNVELVKEAGGAVGRGIVVDDRQRTSLPDVYAAGDNCESVDLCTGARRILAILPNAALQGGTAGTNMAGGDAVFAQGAAFNAIGFFGSHIATAGVYEGESFTERGENSYKKLFWKDNALKGFIIIGDIDRAGIYTSLIREQTPLDTVDFELLKRHPALMAFAGTARAEKLARRQ